jgi:hypothetical protein
VFRTYIIFVRGEGYSPMVETGAYGKPKDGQDDTSAGPERIGVNIPFNLSR